MKSIRRFASIFVLMLCITCNSEEEVGTDQTDPNDPNFEIPDWTEETHSKNGALNYTTVFPQDKVNTLEIKMTSDNWKAIQASMKTLYSADFGGGGISSGGFPDEDPVYVPVSLKYDGKEWYRVGFRLKGNSSLSSSWRKGIYKLPFRLNFDKYEDDYPQIKNQRFYGFKELSMSPGFSDNSLIREKSASDIFRSAGIPSSQTAFYKVYIDFGDGLKYCGVYTMVEVVDDTMIKTQFGSDKGNIYKPESTLSVFLASQFEKKNNEDDNDFTDVQTFIEALNSDLRNTDHAQWKTKLEKTFNVDHYIKWLAVNTTMMNWDTYGRMAHNYYLYHDPVKNLMWIPWDNNESMSNRGGSSVTISLSTVNSSWPLIRFIMDDADYASKYKSYVAQFTNEVFTSAKMNELFDRYHNLIAPYVIGSEAMEQGKYTQLTNTASFTSELATLKQHVINQNKTVSDYLK